MSLADSWGAELSPSGFELQYLQAAEQVTPGVSAATQQEKLPGESYVDALARVVQTYAIADTQRRILNVQLQRAQQGLPPLRAAEYGVGASVNVGLSPDTQKMLLWGALGLGALFVLPRLFR
jgi:hypothetical protein